MTKAESQFIIWDIVLLALTTIFIALVIRVCFYHLVDNETIQENLLILSLSVSVTIVAFQYKSLRKQKVFIAWTILSLVMLGMFLWLYKDTSLALNNNSNGLKVPLILLLFFWICRRSSIKYFGTELSLPTLSRIVNQENRNFFMDYVWTTGSVIIILLGHIL